MVGSPKVLVYSYTIFHSNKEWNVYFLFQAKIDEEYQNQKTLEKPEVLEEPRVRSSSTTSTLVLQKYMESHETVPPEPSVRLPKIVGGEDPDPLTRQRRDKVKEVSLIYEQFIIFDIRDVSRTIKNRRSCFIR